LIGNPGGAIDAAIKCGRTAEALIIAYSQGQDVFKSTLKTFFTETTDTFITSILRHIADKESDELIKKYQLSQWKECIAFIYSLARDQRGHLLKLLATRLLQ
jgi:protein transport protein SEC31